MSSKIKKPKRQKPVVKKPDLSNRGLFENKQYRGGRVKKAKNLKYFEDLIINQFDVVFTRDEKKKLENLVNRANAKRKRILKDTNKIKVFSGGQPLGITRGKMGQESDFAIQRKSKSLNRFTSMDEYNKYVKMLERVNTKGYINQRVSQYKDNYIKALWGQGFPDDLIKEIDNMPDSEFFDFANKETIINFENAYDIYEKENIIQGMRNAVARHKGS